MSNNEYQFYKQAIGRLLPDQDSVRNNVLRQGTEALKTHRVKSWLIPVAAGIAALALVCASVPSVRAAIAQWFTVNHSVENYLAQPKDARPSTPELDAMIDETMIEDAAASSSIEISMVAPEWQAWADKLKPSMGDVLFDGKKLMLSFDMGGGAGELLRGGMTMKDGGMLYPYGVEFGNPQYIKFNTEKYACYVSACEADSERIGYYDYDIPGGGMTDEGLKLLETDDSVLCIATVYFSKEYTGPIFDKESYSDEELGWVKEAQQYDSDFVPWEFKQLKHMSGIQQAELTIPLTATDYTNPQYYEDGSVSYSGTVIGVVRMRFSFDPGAGYESFKGFDINKTAALKGEAVYGWMDWESEPDYVTYGNKTVDLSGISVTAARMDCYASGAELYLDMDFPEGWDEKDIAYFIRSLDPVVKGDGVKLRISGSAFRTEPDDIGLTVYLDMLPSELEAIDLYDVSFNMSRFIDSAFSSGDEPVRLKWSQMHESADMLEELEDCALTFKLK